MAPLSRSSPALAIVPQLLLLLLLLLLLDPIPAGAAEPESPESSARACVVSFSRSGATRRACLDISAICERLHCGPEHECALDPAGTPVCLAGAVGAAQQCGSEDQRLAQPCPDGAAVLGFGRGCTFCDGTAAAAVEEEAAAPQPRYIGAGGLRPPLGPSDSAGRACVSTRRRCIDIGDRCRDKRCPVDTACALDRDGYSITCLPARAGQFNNCGPEQLRLSQPCPADAGVRGYGQGCTFCVGSNPFVPRPPLPPPHPVKPQPPRQTDDQSLNACLVIYNPRGESKRECVDISNRCQQRNCPSDTVCGLNGDEQIECFPSYFKSFENCGPDEFRLEQPCPADSAIRGFGQGCTFCNSGIYPLTPRPDPEVLPPVLIDLLNNRSEKASNACVVVNIGSEEFKKECFDISHLCQQHSCPPSTVCGLNLEEQIECFPKSVKDFENCGSDDFRLTEPCPADVGIRGFGQGCTFCVGDNPTEPPTDNPATAPNACVVIHIESGSFKRECYDISAQCTRRNCPLDTVCGLDPNEQTVCFSSEVKQFENCEPDEFRLSQPCPQVSEIRGFGQGCTFCDGDNPPGQTTEPSTRPPTSGPRGGTMRTTTPPKPTSSARSLACINRPVGNGRFKRRCRDISADCWRLACATGLTCALDQHKQPRCFGARQLSLRNCQPSNQPPQRSCPTGTQVVAYGAQCTFCRVVPPTTTPKPTTVAPRIRACYVSSAGSDCIDISRKCRKSNCARGEVCALVPSSLRKPRCLKRTDLGQSNCGTEQKRRKWPCPVSTPQAFAAGCTYCHPRACVARPRGRSKCEDISRRCAQAQCRVGAKCVLNQAGRTICLRRGWQSRPFCGTERQRLNTPCGKLGTAPIAYGPRCNYCSTRQRAGARG